MRRALAILLTGVALAGGAWADPLVDAAQAGNTEQALALIEDGAEVAAMGGDGATALHWAVHHGDRALAERLLEAGADVSATNYFGATPMIEAALLGDAEMIEILLDAGADVESPNRDGQTALMTVARTENLEAARLLLERGADPDRQEDWRGQTALMWAAAQSRPAMVRLLLEHGADPNVRSKVNDYPRHITAEARYVWRPPSGWTALLLASRQGCLECVQALLDAGADIDLANPEGVSPLLIAAMNLHFDVGAYLLQRDANPDKWDWRGRNPLYAVIDVNTLPHGGRADIPSTDETGALELARMLLEAGANPNLQLKLNPGYRNTKDDRGADRELTVGATPLLRAAKAFDTEAVALLAEYDPLVDLPNDNGTTPLMIAAGMGSSTIDTRGYYDTPDTQRQSIATLTMLLEMGADINARNNGGETALFAAAQWGWTEVVDFLVTNGARLDIANADGHSALDIALGRGRRSTEPNEETAARIRELMAEQGIDVEEPTRASRENGAAEDPA